MSCQVCGKPTPSHTLICHACYTIFTTMPIAPTNCYICKKTWAGASPVCDNCKAQLLGLIKPPPPPQAPCSYCSGSHDLADCLAAAVAKARLINQAQNAQPKWNTMPRPPRKRPIYTNYGIPLMKMCRQCKGNYLIESKAGSVCTSCNTIVHNPCRNCGSLYTHGIGDFTEQFIECSDCQFIE